MPVFNYNNFIIKLKKYIFFNNNLKGFGNNEWINDKQSAEENF